MVPTEEQVREALRNVLDPEIGRPIEDIGMLHSIEVTGGDVRVHVLITIEGCPLKDRITNDVTGAVQPLEGVERVEVELTPMSPQQREALVGRCAAGAAAAEPRRTILFPPETAVIAVASGKGGVGKSSVTVNLAAALVAEGHRVGVLDADVWGFSVPRMLGVTGKPVGFNDMILPLEGHGVKVISMGFFVPEEQPVIWRGPMLHKAVEQFLGDVYWGDLDFLLCDLPPGTGDVSISLASFLPGAAMLVVTTPQEAARKVAERAGKMAERTNLRAIGVIENMSYFVCPHCGEPEAIFGAGGGRLAAETLEVPLMAQVPLDPSIRAGGDGGVPIVVAEPEAPASVAFRERRRGPARDQVEGRQAAPAHGHARRPRGGRRPPRALALAAGIVRRAGSSSPAGRRSSGGGGGDEARRIGPGEQRDEADHRNRESGPLAAGHAEHALIDAQGVLDHPCRPVDRAEHEREHAEAPERPRSAYRRRNSRSRRTCRIAPSDGPRRRSRGVTRREVSRAASWVIVRTWPPSSVARQVSARRRTRRGCPLVLRTRAASSSACRGGRR